MIDIKLPEANEVMDLGLDWLTITTVDGEGSQELIETARTYISEWAAEDALPKDWRSMGYSGVNYGPIRYGRRNGDEAILIISGKEAEHFALLFTIPTARVTRVDIQVTIAHAHDDPSLAHRTYRELQNKEAVTGKPMKLTYLSSNTGDSLAIGNRKSAKYLRMYDKGGQTGTSPIGQVWRYEVEYKKSVAKQVLAKIGGSSDRYASIAGLVFAEFEKRGVIPTFNPAGKYVAMETSVEVTTVDTKLGWLQRCVAPVITQLVNLGYEDEVRSSLKLCGVYRRE